MGYYSLKKVGKNQVRIVKGSTTKTGQRYWAKQGWKYVKASSQKAAVGKAFKNMELAAKKKKKRSSGGFFGGGDIVGGYRLPNGGI